MQTDVQTNIRPVFGYSWPLKPAFSIQEADSKLLANHLTDLMVENPTRAPFELFGVLMRAYILSLTFQVNGEYENQFRRLANALVDSFQSGRPN